MPTNRPVFLDSLRAGTVLADGGIGSLIFQMTGRLASTEFAYETLNLRNPELIKRIHMESLAAGSVVLTTNTFAANSAELSAAGVGHEVEEINRAAITLALEAIAQYESEYPAVESDFYVLGSIGPGGQSLEAYSEQIDALISAGVDALLLETFADIDLAMQLTEQISARTDAPPVIVHAALDPGVGDMHRWPIEPAEFVSMAANAGASVAGINCVAPWAAAAFVDEAISSPAAASGKILLSAMPNAGGFERIGHRFLTRANAEYMGALARQLGDSGASLVGGCCEVHPEHLREMSAYLKSRNATPETTYRAGTITEASNDPAILNARNDERSANGEFSRKILSGEFAISVEMVSPSGVDSKALELRAKMVARIVEGGLADAVDVTDGSRGIPLIPPGDLIALIRRQLGWHERDELEFIAHFTGRDLNTLALQSRLMGYHWLGIRSVLFVTGDPPKMSPTYPRASAVFDMNSTQMIRATAELLNQGRDFGGNPLTGGPGSATSFTIGTGFEPEAINIQRELTRLQAKIDAGADYVMTQPVFDMESLRLAESLRNSVRVLPGVMVLRSADHAKRIAQVPGVNLPNRILDEMTRFENPGDQAKAGMDLAIAQAHSYRSDGWGGIYLMSPASLGAAVSVLKALAE